MRSISGIVALIILLPLLSSFSTAIPIEKSYCNTYKGTETSNTENGTVTISIHKGYNPNGLLSRLGYTVDFNNTIGTNVVAFYSNITYHYRSHKAYNECYATLYPICGFRFSVLSIPLPALPFKVTITINTNTSTNLSLTRTGIMLFNCYLWFTSGQESITGTS